MSKNAAIIDGNSIIYRAYFATQANKTDAEAIKNFHHTLIAIRKMIRRFMNTIEEIKYAVVTFDTSRSTFRKEKFEEYKSNRKSMPVALFNNLNKIRQIFTQEGWKILDAPDNYEGDDAVATLTSIFSKKKIKTTVFSSDRDLLQLVSANTSVFLVRKGELQQHTIDNFPELNNGLMPHQIPFQKALSGDSSDNYKGLTGIGPITSRNWLIKYGNIENIYKNIEKLKPSHQKVLKENQEKLSMFLELSLLVKNLKIPSDLKQYEYLKKNETNSGSR